MGLDFVRGFRWVCVVRAVQGLIDLERAIFWKSGMVLTKYSL